MASTSSFVTKPSRLVSSLANSLPTCSDTSERVITRSVMTLICMRGATGATGGATPEATPGGGGGACCATAGGYATASAATAPPIKSFFMTLGLLLKIEDQLNHPSLLAIERNRNG